jgi:flavin reductase (DIM6/NTAB) family NADH-FMN oxidoreductase RutF
MYYDTARNDHGLALDPFKAVLVPRPIGWISTVSAAGIANLAPYSFFNAVAEHPHYVCFGSDGRKDSLANIEATGEFAVNLATHELRDAMNASAAVVPPHVDEFDLAGLDKAPCHTIRAPRVAASPACFECRLAQIVPLPSDDGHVAHWMVLGRVVGVHIDDRFIRDGRVDTAAMKPLARLGYAEYATIETTWRMRRAT